MRQTFKQFLSEAKNLHLEHAEDLIFDRGYQGAIDAVNYLGAVADLLKGHTGSKVNVTVKYDGAPAIFAGINPENGKFFVGTKSVFNSTNPKINYTVTDIRANHSGDLAEKLTLALQYLPSLGIDGVVQGDMMFTHGDLKKQIIDGVDYVTFKPNTILYAIPLGTPLANKILKAKLGIVFHTAYTGKTMADMSASFNVKAHSFKHNPNVWFDDATYKDESGTATLTAGEEKEVRRHIDAAQSLLKNIKKSEFNKLSANTKLIDLIKIHLNAKVRGGQHIGDPIKHVDELIEFIHDRFEAEKEKVKTAAAKEKKEERKQFKHGLIDQYRGLLINIFQFQVHINEAKIALIRKLESAKRIGHFLETEDGLISTAPEGFVAVDHLGSNAVKLVDRLTFSKANFNAVKSWTK